MREKIARLLCKQDGWEWDELRPSGIGLFRSPAQSDFHQKADEILAIEGLAVVDRDADPHFLSPLGVYVRIPKGWVKEVTE